ncbi:LamB/YcsF family protein [Zoogloea sp.]|uniref:LamB/YcsF family protein n=1 Tax=Zoogloea sp. TaxID=49181 RepID=UPI0026012401|nr:5-oxoprolinase subunit PxpA [Zoogloea sp.]MCK6393537.1 5-oxoprolinase subunit PxpA [Zoogloea sp.]
MTRLLNLNADLGESFGAWQMGNDAELLGSLDSASIACGFHAGDPLVMRDTLRRAKAAGVSIGAHPAYPDLQGFGRRPMTLPPAELEAILIYQMAGMAGMARTEGLAMAHVKPHGALSNMACTDATLADTVATAIRIFDPGLILLAPACSALASAGRRAGLRVVEEIFADRAYQDDGSLVPRSRPGALIHGAAASLAHVLAMLEARSIIAVSGTHLPTPIGSICVHGDGPEAVATARALRAGLLERGYRLAGLEAIATD